MAPSFSDLAARAAKVKDATVSRIVDTKDRHSSHSSKTMDVMDPEYQRTKPQLPPPAPITRTKPVTFLPPPVRTNTISSDAPSAPPVTRNTRADVAPPPSSSSSAPPPRPALPVRRARPEPVNKLDWANLSSEDKKIFFSWLDEYFADYFNKAVAPPSNNKPLTVQAGKNFMNSAPSFVHSGKAALSTPVAPGPPKIAVWSKPQQHSSATSNLAMTYPPPSTHGSAALDIAHYFHPSTHWDSAWYNANSPLKPPFVQDGDTWQMGGQVHGTNKELWYAVFCRDLSICWSTITFSTTGPSDPNGVQRTARYLPPPRPLDQQTLIDAHATYGETIASFAEGFVESQQYCARGECWDLASEALKYFDQFDYVPKPIPSLSQTHGHMIAWFRASDGRQAGRWFGGDDRVRRGDIVQWRSVTITLSVPGGTAGKMMLGAPDHTSIVVHDTIPLKNPVDGESLLPEEFGRLYVVEQSVSTSMLPKREQHDLKELAAGEIWIYRPIGMRTYLGTEFGVRYPDDVHALTL